MGPVRKPGLPPRDDPRNPRRALPGIVLTLLVLGWFIWVLANWPDSVIFVFH